MFGLQLAACSCTPRNRGPTLARQYLTFTLPRTPVESIITRTDVAYECFPVGNKKIVCSAVIFSMVIVDGGANWRCAAGRRAVEDRWSVMFYHLLRKIM